MEGIRGIRAEKEEDMNRYNTKQEGEGTKWQTNKASGKIRKDKEGKAERKVGREGGREAAGERRIWK